MTVIPEPAVGRNPESRQEALSAHLDSGSAAFCVVPE
jgi:hypothetical protein